MIKNIIYNFLASVLPRSILNFLGSLNGLEFLRDWLFDRKKVLKPIRVITWNNLNFYFRAPLQILRKAKTMECYGKLRNPNEYQGTLWKAN